MSRKIKFRDYRKVPNESQNKMRYSDKFSTLERFFRKIDRDMDAEHFLMQFTGATDTNGVDIYEGDIVKLRSKKYGDHLAVIVYKKHGFRMDGNKSIFKDYALSISEVVGNIYENKDL